MRAYKKGCDGGVYLNDIRYPAVSILQGPRHEKYLTDLLQRSSIIQEPVHRLQSRNNNYYYMLGEEGGATKDRWQWRGCGRWITEETFRKRALGWLPPYGCFTYESSRI